MIKDTSVKWPKQQPKTCQKDKVKKLSYSRVKWPRDKDYKWQSNLSKVGMRFVEFSSLVVCVCINSNGER